MTMTSVSKQSLAIILLGAALLLARANVATAFDDVSRDLGGKGKGGSSKSSEKVGITALFYVLFGLFYLRLFK